MLSSVASDRIPVLLASDHTGLPRLATTIKTVVSSRENETYEFIILLDYADAESDRVLNEIPQCTRWTVRAIDMTTWVSKYLPLAGTSCRTSTGLPGVSYYRLLAPWILPSYDRCIYLDYDVCVEGGLRTLYDWPLNGAWIGGVPDLGITGFPRQRLSRQVVQASGGDFDRLVQTRTYLNAGVLLMDLAAIRSQWTIESWVPSSNLIALSLQALADQDILNGRCYRHSCILPSYWNVQIDNMSPAERGAIRHAGGSHIYHFNRPWIKPWDARSRAPLCEKALWLAHHHAPWPGDHQPNEFCPGFPYLKYHGAEVAYVICAKESELQRVFGTLSGLFMYTTGSVDAFVFLQGPQSAVDETLTLGSTLIRDAASQSLQVCSVTDKLRIDQAYGIVPWLVPVEYKLLMMLSPRLQVRLDLSELGSKCTQDSSNILFGCTADTFPSDDRRRCLEAAAFPIGGVASTRLLRTGLIGVNGGSLRLQVAFDRLVDLINMSISFPGGDNERWLDVLCGLTCDAIQEIPARWNCPAVDPRYTLFRLTYAGKVNLLLPEDHHE